MSPLILMAALATHPAAASEHPDDVAQAALTDSAFTRGTAGEVSDLPWWTGFRDDELNALMDSAFADNADLAASWARVEQSRGRQLQAASALLPQLSLDMSLNTAPDDSLGFGFGLPSSSSGTDTGGTGGFGGSAATQTYNNSSLYYSGSAFLSAGWSLDLWGRSALSTRASHFDTLASAGNTQAQRIAIASAVAGAWYDVLVARQRLDYVGEQLRVSQELLELVELRYQGGEATALDVLQQRQQLASARLQLPATRLQRDGAVQRLAVLTGQTPRALSAALPDTSALPELPPPPAVGRPDDLLENRPDLRAAYAAARAARARRASAALGYLPSLSVSGKLGYQGIDDTSNDLTEAWDTQDTWSVGAALSIPLFTGARTTGVYQDSSAGEEAALQALRGAALGAIQEVESALLQDAELAEQRAAWQDQAQAARLSFEESEARYIEGLTSYINVLNSLNAAQAAELNVLQSHRDQITARIALHSALGGGWTLADQGE